MGRTTTIPTSMSKHSFWVAVNVLINKSHVVNKRLWGSKIMYKSECVPMNYPWVIADTGSLLDPLKNIDLSNFENILSHLQLRKSNDKIEPEESIEVLLIDLLPKIYTEVHAYQVICINKNDTKVLFFDVSSENTKQHLSADFNYTISLNNNEVALQAECDENSKPFQWLSNTVLPQFTKWGEETLQEGNGEIKTGSLSLVSKDLYYVKYNELKIKYGKEMVKIWPECTDPSKFVYEDVAIATYLLLLWEEERKQQNSKTLQTFVDLGCGNGLLVYILAMEGHRGKGVDVRKRNIWKMYPSQVKLEEQTITPSDINLFPDTDWLIGNHSDELSPWIPVMAARSSFKCRFFLLPCCAYNFDGTKYQRQDSSKSQYSEYLEYLKKLTTDCGFITEVDRLKIPSTKRICIVGIKRNYRQDEHIEHCNKIQSLCGQTKEQHQGASKVWIEDFKPREYEEKVKNCTRIDKGLIASIVSYVTNYLLKDNSSDGSWSPGRTAELHELAQLVPKDMLKSLKAECGGLQTLLKNHHHIFKVQSGKVQFRFPKTIDEIEEKGITKAKRLKTNKVNIQRKPCWFYNNHPQGCPLSDITCSFLH